jgi:hypothetical protein
LALQQGVVLERNLSVKVRTFIGNDIYGWSARRWKSEIKDVDVLVLTTQIALDLFNSATIKMQDARIISIFITQDTTTRIRNCC